MNSPGRLHVAIRFNQRVLFRKKTRFEMNVKDCGFSERDALCAKMTETTTSSFITVEGEEDMDVKSHGKQWESEPGGQ